MREKIYNVLKRIYGILMMISFFGGLLPLIPFIAAIIIGGGADGTGQTLAVFLYKQYYPWVIAMASVAVLIGLIAMYIGGKESMSTKAFKNKK